MRNTTRSVSVVTILAFVLGGCGDESDGPRLSIEVLPSNNQCLVRGVEMHCEGVAVYLRENLKLSSDEFIEVTSDPALATFEAVNPVMESLKQAGFTKVIGSITLDETRPTEATQQ
jgi:biopolymer transport protein ExbD